MNTRRYPGCLSLVARRLHGRSLRRAAVGGGSWGGPAAFLHHLETRRNNQVSTRNVRLGAIRSFFRFVGAHYPEHLALAQRILSAPLKRTTSREIQHLDLSEI